MASKIIWSPQAEESFEEITDDLLERWSEKTAVDFVQKAFKSIDQIAWFPKSCPSFEQRPDIRRCKINPHISLFYRIQDDKVELITFWSNRKSLENLELGE